MTSRKLYSVGLQATQDQVEESLIDALDGLEMTDRNGNIYVFRNIVVKRKENANSPSVFKAALLSGRSILASVYADIYMKKKGSTHETLVEKHVHIASAPQMVDARGTFVVKGSDYNVVNQLRKNSAPYIVRGANDMDIRASFNLAKGRNFTIELNPADSKFYMHVGSTTIILRALAEVLDITKEDLNKAIGEDLAAVNWDSVTPSNVLSGLRKMYKKFYEYKKVDPNTFEKHELIALLKEYFDMTKVDAATTKLLYNGTYHKVSKDLVLTVLKEYVKVFKKEKNPHNQDDLYFHRLYTPNLLFKDRIQKTLPAVNTSISYRLAQAKTNKEKAKIFSNIYTRPLVSMVAGSNVSRIDPQYNPLGVMVTPSTVTPLGMGGVNDSKAIRDAQRDLHPSNMGIIDPTVSSQGQGVGVLLRATNNFKVDEDGDIYLNVATKKGTKTHVPLTVLKDKYLALPDVRPDTKKKKVHAVHNGSIVEVSKDKVDYFFPHGPEDTLSLLDTLFPMMNAVQGNRNFMATRQITQSLPLAYRETPLVQTKSSTGENFYKKVRDALSSFMPFKAPADGVVKKVKDGKITIKGDDGKTYYVDYARHLPLATNTGIHQIPTVHSGDRVKKGQRILKDNYTTADGKVAFGVNLHTAFMPYRGENSEDATVISETAARKLTSVHYYKYEVLLGDKLILGKKSFLNQFPNKYSREQLANIEDNGIIKQNTRVKRGDPLTLALTRVTPDEALKKISKLSKNITVSLGDASVVYDHGTIGEVIEVSTKSNVLTITVKTLEKAGVGDKISGLYGNKGVISKVLPDDKMMVDEKGKPIDVIFAASVVPSRMNPAQIHEQALGKIVKEKKLPIYEFEPLSNPGGKPLDEFVKGELKKYKVKDKEYLTDPVTGKKVNKPVSTGYMYTIKLLKGDKDTAARGVGPTYTSNQQPAKGGHEGAKAIGQAEFYALAAHGARNILSDMGAIKGQQNSDYWRAALLGGAPMPVTGSFAFKRMKANLTSAGAVFKETKDGYQLLPLTDKTTDELAGHRVVKTPALLRSKTLEPLKEGLYDPKNTGGLNGTYWSKIKLEDGLISPIVEDYVRLVLGKSKGEMREWEAQSSTKEMKKELDAVNVNKIIKTLKEKSKKNGKLTSNELKILRFLSNLKDKGIKLSDLVITKIPVPPPIYRPMTQLGDGSIQLADTNHFYKDIMIANEGVKELKDVPFAKSEAKQELIYNIHALVGTEKTHNRQLINKNAKSILESIGGAGSPKTGFVHAVLMKKNQDLSGRARIIPNSNLDMDEVGLPYAMAWELYKPFVKATLVKSGLTPVDAEKQIKDKTELAKRTLQSEVDKRPALINRAPTLHRFGILATKPRLVTGNSLQVSMFHTNPFNADFDGDAMQVHIPVTKKAVEEANTLLLSKNLIGDVSDDQLIVGWTPETIAGFYFQAKHDKKSVDKELKKLLPSDVPLPKTYDKKGMKALALDIAKSRVPNKALILQKIKELGDEYSTFSGLTVGVDDVSADKEVKKQRDAILAEAKKELQNAKRGTMEYAKILEKYQKKIINMAKKLPGDVGEMVRSGIKGSDNQIAGMILTPTIAYNPHDPLRTATLTTGSFSEGLNYKDFWEQVTKARTDAVSTAMSVAVPGTYGKLMTSALNKMVISEVDCKTEEGVYVDPSTTSIRGSLLAEDIGKFKRNTIISESNEKAIKKFKKIKIRTPQTCAAKEGVCAMCYGADASGKLYEVGTHVGLRVAQGTAEPLAQMALDSKHGGRSLTKDVDQGGLTTITSVFSSDRDRQGMAVVALEDGVVEDITTLPSGATIISMDDGTKYTADPSVEVKVKVGDDVGRGDVLSTGIVPFTDVIEAKGILAGRKAFTDGFKDALESSGRKLSYRTYSLLGKAVANHVKLFGDLGDFTVGDVIPYITLKEELAKISVPTRLDKVEEGMQLGEEFDDLSAGTILTKREARRIATAKHIPGTKKTFIRIVKDKVPLEWVARTLYTAGLADEDWMHHIASRYIKKELISTTAEGKESKKKTLSPSNVWIQGKPLSTKKDDPHY